jgi:hypothetical protein
MLGIGESTVQESIRTCADAINYTLFHARIGLTQGDKTIENMNKWFADTGIPGIAATLDCTHIRIRKPPEDHVKYLDRRGNYSLIVQGTAFEKQSV